MDARLLTIHGHRPVFLRRIDLPGVTTAIVSHILGRARAYRVNQANVGAVLIQGQGIDVLVREEDWDKISPYIADGTFSYRQDSTVASFAWSTRTPDTPVEVAVPDLYTRVLTTLQTIFTDDFPTSPL